VDLLPTVELYHKEMINPQTASSPWEKDGEGFVMGEGAGGRLVSPLLFCFLKLKRVGPFH
jgi:hypothetical protein